MNKETVSIPYYVAEGMIDRLMVTNKRLWIMCIVLILLLVGSNTLWIVYESQFEDFVVTQESKDGYNNFIGNDGDIYNGEANNTLQTEKNGRK